MPLLCRDVGSTGPLVGVLGGVWSGPLPLSPAGHSGQTLPSEPVASITLVEAVPPPRSKGGSPGLMPLRKPQSWSLPHLVRPGYAEDNEKPPSPSRFTL